LAGTLQPARGEDAGPEPEEVDHGQHDRPATPPVGHLLVVLGLYGYVTSHRVFDLGSLLDATAEIGGWPKAKGSWPHVRPHRPPSSARSRPVGTRTIRADNLANTTVTRQLESSPAR
jgi:hypothetical protein